jgi:hypothetical protein
MSIAVRSGAAAVLAAAVLIAAGCGETVIDDVKAEGAIQDSLEKSLDEKVTSVSCPSDEEVEKGKTFDCTVDFSNGTEATATLKILDDDANVKIVDLKESGK